MKLLRKNTYLIVCAVVIVIAVFSLSKIYWDNQSYQTLDNNTQNISLIGTYQINGQGEKKTLPKDYFFNLSGKNEIVVEGYFSHNIEKNQLLIMRIDNLKVEVLINDKPVYTFGDEMQKPQYVRSMGNTWGYFVSEGIHIGDKVTIKLENIYTNHTNESFQTFFSKMYNGYQAEIMSQYLQQKLVNTCLSIFIICLGIIAFVFSFVFRSMSKRIETTFIFACLSIISGLWFLVDFDIQSFFIPYTIFNNSFDIIVMMLTESLVLIYFTVSFKNKIRSLTFILSYVWLGFIALTIVTQFMSILDFYDYTQAIEILSFISIIVILIGIFKEWKTYHDYDTKILIFSTLLLCFGGLADVVCMTFHVLPYIIWFKISFFLFMIIQFHSIIRSIFAYVNEYAKLEAVEKQKEELQRIVEYQQLLNDSTRGLYESINEVNITADCLVGEKTVQYFENLGVRRDTPYTQALQMVAENEVKIEYVKGYVEILGRQHILEAYEKGIEYLTYDFIVNKKHHKEYWMRIVARIFFFEGDQSVRLITYRQNIDKQKRRELKLIKQAQVDLMTNIYNKVTAENMITQRLMSSSLHQKYAFMIIDIDNFKSINDNLGHNFGDLVIKEFAHTIKRHFGDNDIVGRIGGDEFCVLTEYSSEIELYRFAIRLNDALCQAISDAHKRAELSSSIGISFYPKDAADFDDLYTHSDAALYKVKNSGKHNVAIYKNK